MKLINVVAGAVMATAAVGATGAGTASAGCAITLEVHNRSDVGVTVDWDQSDVRIGGDIPFWKRLGSGDTHVAAGDTVRANFVADLGCGVMRQYRLDVNEGGSSWFTYHGLTHDLTPHIHID